eukprot:GHVQ01039721.1.p1 GENE.GHVQ01039721.1~~GHVQ01039721.1.p1  ORF type:complete len:993 (+),score=176.16 GHVQ01039721.1:442-3420(+)
MYFSHPCYLRSQPLLLLLVSYGLVLPSFILLPSTSQSPPTQTQHQLLKDEPRGGGSLTHIHTHSQTNQQSPSSVPRTGHAQVSAVKDRYVRAGHDHINSSSSSDRHYLYNKNNLQRNSQHNQPLSQNQVQSSLVQHASKHNDTPKRRSSTFSSLSGNSFVSQADTLKEQTSDSPQSTSSHLHHQLVSTPRTDGISSSALLSGGESLEKNDRDAGERTRGGERHGVYSDGYFVWLTDVHFDPLYSPDAPISNRCRHTNQISEHDSETLSESHLRPPTQIHTTTATTHSTHPPSFDSSSSSSASSSSSSSLSHLGRYGCDTSVDLLKATLQSIQKEIQLRGTDVKFIINTGDYAAHYKGHPTVDKIRRMRSIELFTKWMKTFFPQQQHTTDGDTLQLIYVIGNNDLPHDYHPLINDNAWAERLLSLWGHTFIAEGDSEIVGCGDTSSTTRHDSTSNIHTRQTDTLAAKFPECPKGPSKSQKNTFLQGMYYYTMLNKLPGVRVLCLNTVLYSKQFNGPTTEDPAGQFAWMESQLATAEARRESILMLGHIPPGSKTQLDFESWTAESEWHLQYNLRYRQIVHDWKHVLIGQLFGHLHIDTFGVQIEDPPSTQTPPLPPGFPTNPSLVSPQFSPAISPGITHALVSQTPSPTPAGGSVISGVLVAPSVTPISGGNPSWRLVRYSAIIDESWNEHRTNINNTNSNENITNHNTRNDNANNSNSKYNNNHSQIQSSVSSHVALQKQPQNISSPTVILTNYVQLFLPFPYNPLSLTANLNDQLPECSFSSPESNSPSTLQAEDIQLSSRRWRWADREPYEKEMFVGEGVGHGPQLLPVTSQDGEVADKGERWIENTNFIEEYEFQDVYSVGDLTAVALETVLRSLHSDKQLYKLFRLLKHVLGASSTSHRHCQAIIQYCISLNLNHHNNTLYKNSSDHNTHNSTNDDTPPPPTQQPPNPHIIDCLRSQLSTEEPENNHRDAVSITQPEFLHNGQPTLVQ